MAGENMVNKYFYKNLPYIFISIGTVIIIYSAFSLIKAKYEQQVLMEEHKYLTVEKEADNLCHVPTEEVSIEAEEEKTAREDYKNGMMTIAIPKIHINAAVMEGTTKELLKKGPGLYEISPLPDQDGSNVCIAGHRTTYGAWFGKVDKLKENDEIVLNYNDVEYLYRVEKVFIVDKKDWWITEPAEDSVITLTSCHPPKSSKQRIVVRGKLEKVSKS